jgi:hypothetical protein
MKYWEIVADNLKKAGWSWGCVSALDSKGRTIWIVDAHRDNGKRFVVHADEKLSRETQVRLNRHCGCLDHVAQIRGARRISKERVLDLTSSNA